MALRIYGARSVQLKENRLSLPLTRLLSTPWETLVGCGAVDNRSPVVYL